jgi:hypothetical protein
MAESFAPDLDLFEGGFALPDDLGEQVLEFMGEVPNYQDMSIPVNEQYLASWLAANQVTSANNNTPLSNEQLQQIKTFAALQPKYVPVVPGEGDRYNKRMEQAKQTPGAIYSNFETYATAMQEHNDQVQQYIEQENIPTSTVVDGKTLYLNLGTTPAYYQEQEDGGQLKNIVHSTQRSGNTYYTQTGEVGQYGTFARDAVGPEKTSPLKDAAPFLAAAAALAIGVPIYKAATAGAAAGSTGAAAGGELPISQILSGTKTYQTSQPSFISKLTSAFETGTGAAEKVLSEGLAAVTGASATTASGAPIVQIPTLGQIAKGGTVAAGLGAVAEGLSTTGGLPGGITYSGPGAGPDGSFDPSVIYNIAATADAQAEEEDTSEQDALDITAAVNAAVDALTKPEDTQEVIAANDAVTVANDNVLEATQNIATVIEETESAVASAEGYANYMRGRFGPLSSNYKRAKAKADAAKLEAEREVDAARRKELEAQAEYNDAIDLQQGTYKDAQDAYRVAQVEARRTAEAAVQKRIAAQREQETVDLPVVVPVEPVPPPEEPPLEVAPPVVAQPVEEPTETTGGGDEGTPAEPVVAQPTDVGEEQPASTDIIAAQLREAIGAEEDPNVKEGLQLELDKWLSGGPTEYQTVPSGPPPPDVTGDFDVTDAVSWVARLTDYFKEQPASNLDIEPTDPLADDFPEVPLTGGPVAFDPVEPVEPVEDPTGGTAETGVGAGDIGTGGGEGAGIGAGVGAGLGAGLTLGLASGMLKPQAVTDTLFKDIPFKKNYQAPEIIGAIEDLPTYKAPQVGLFQGII